MPALLSVPQAHPAPRAVDEILPTKHPQYYLDDGNVVIRVQNSLFKLDLAVLHEKSPVLRMIVPPVYAGKMRFQGFDDGHPFMLQETTERDFVRLLWVLYPSDQLSWNEITTDDWISILKSATKYQIEDICGLATARLHASSIDPIRKIAIWEEYHLDSSQLRSSYVALCLRPEPLTLAMTMALGLKNFTKLAAAREAFHQRVGFGCCKQYSPEQKQVVAENIIGGAFFRHAQRSKRRKT